MFVTKDGSCVVLSTSCNHLAGVSQKNVLLQVYLKDIVEFNGHLAFDKPWISVRSLGIVGWGVFFVWFLTDAFRSDSVPTAVTIPTVINE